MKVTNLFALLAAGAAGVMLVRRFTASAADTPTAVPSTGVPMVENVLHQHEGEDTPMVQAFEQALEEERRHEEELAREVGVKG